MKRRTGKKIGKILLLVALLAIVGGIVYAVLTWPMYPLSLIHISEPTRH